MIGPKSSRLYLMQESFWKLDNLHLICLAHTETCAFGICVCVCVCAHAVARGDVQCIP